MKTSFSFEFRCNPKHERELINRIAEAVDRFREKNKYDGNSMAMVKICDPMKESK